MKISSGLPLLHAFPLLHPHATLQHVTSTFGRCYRYVAELLEFACIFGWFKMSSGCFTGRYSFITKPDDDLLCRICLDVAEGARSCSVRSAWRNMEGTSLALTAGSKLGLSYYQDSTSKSIHAYCRKCFDRYFSSRWKGHSGHSSQVHSYPTIHPYQHIYPHIPTYPPIYPYQLTHLPTHTHLMASCFSLMRTVSECPSATRRLARLLAAEYRSVLALTSRLKSSNFFCTAYRFKGHQN